MPNSAIQGDCLLIIGFYLNMSIFLFWGRYSCTGEVREAGASAEGGRSDLRFCFERHHDCLARHSFFGPTCYYVTSFMCYEINVRY
jgi:hypothetical protein